MTTGGPQDRPVGNTEGPASAGPSDAFAALDAAPEWSVRQAASDCAEGVVFGGAAGRLLSWGTKMWIRNHVVKMVLPVVLRR